MFLKSSRHSLHTKGRVSLSCCKCFSSCGNVHQKGLPATKSNVQKWGFLLWMLRHSVRHEDSMAQLEAMWLLFGALPIDSSVDVTSCNMSLYLLTNQVSWFWTFYLTGWNISENLGEYHIFFPFKIRGNWSMNTLWNFGGLIFLHI